MDNTSVLKMNKRTNRVSCIFSAYVVIIPVIQYYKSPLSIFNLATFLAIAFFIVFAFLSVSKRQLGMNKETHLRPARIYVVYITLNVIITTFYYDRGLNWDNINAYCRMLLLFVALLLMGYRHFDKTMALKVLEIVLIINSLLIIIQMLFRYVLSVGISFSIPQLLTEANYGKMYDRFSGFYMEPAHFSQSAVLYLCLTIFDDNFKNNHVRPWKQLLVIVGIVLSGSGQGYFILLAMYFMWLLFSFRKKTISGNRLIFALFSIIVALIAIVLLSKVEFVRNAVSRVTSENGIFDSEAFIGRTYTNTFFDGLSNTQKWIGVGFGHEFDVVNKGLYINSLYTLLIQCGYTSIFLLGYILGYVFIHSQIQYKVFVIIYAITMSFAAVGNPTGLCFYLLFLLPRDDKSVQDKCMNLFSSDK